MPTFRAPLINVCLPNTIAPLSSETQPNIHAVAPPKFFKLNLEGLEEDPEPPIPIKKSSHETTQGIIKKTKSQMP